MLLKQSSTSVGQILCTGRGHGAKGNGPLDLLAQVSSRALDVNPPSIWARDFGLPVLGQTDSTDTSFANKEIAFKLQILRLSKASALTRDLPLRLFGQRC